MIELEDALTSIEDWIRTVRERQQGRGVGPLHAHVFNLGVTCHLLGPKLKKLSERIERDAAAALVAEITPPVVRAVKQTVILDASGEVTGVKAQEVKPQEINLELF